MGEGQVRKSQPPSGRARCPATSRPRSARFWSLLRTAAADSRCRRQRRKTSLDHLAPRRRALIEEPYGPLQRVAEIQAHLLSLRGRKRHSHLSLHRTWARGQKFMILHAGPLVQRWRAGVYYPQSIDCIFLVVPIAAANGLNSARDTLALHTSWIRLIAALHGRRKDGSGTDPYPPIRVKGATLLPTATLPHSGRLLRGPDTYLTGQKAKIASGAEEAALARIPDCKGLVE